MGSALQALVMALQLLPGLIVTAEKAFSGKEGSGQAKKDLVVNGVGAALTVAGHDATQTGQVMESVGQINDSVVNILKSAGVLEQAKAAPGKPSAPSA